MRLEANYDQIIEAYLELYPDRNLDEIHFFFDEIQFFPVAGNALPPKGCQIRASARKFLGWRDLAGNRYRIRLAIIN